jgi:hypothetical protein
MNGRVAARQHLLLHRCVTRHATEQAGIHQCGSPLCKVRTAWVPYICVDALQKDEFLRLAINAIHNDLISRNEAFQSLALTFVSNSEWQDLVKLSAVPDSLYSMLVHTSPCNTCAVGVCLGMTGLLTLCRLSAFAPAVSGPEMAEALTPDVLKLLVRIWLCR